VVLDVSLIQIFRTLSALVPELTEVAEFSLRIGKWFSFGVVVQFFVQATAEITEGNLERLRSLRSFYLNLKRKSDVE